MYTSFCLDIPVVRPNSADAQSGCTETRSGRFWGLATPTIRLDRYDLDWTQGRSLEYSTKCYLNHLFNEEQCCFTLRENHEWMSVSVEIPSNVVKCAGVAYSSVSKNPRIASTDGTKESNVGVIPAYDRVNLSTCQGRPAP